MFKVAWFMSGNNQEKFLLGLLATALLFFFFLLFSQVFALMAKLVLIILIS